MASKREKAPARHMRNIALVICEGETEENYLSILKIWYKSPIKVLSHIEGTKVTQRLIDSRTNELKISKRDKLKVFLMYDMDVPAINKKLLACKAEKLLSNPCIELWLLLHAKNQKTALSTKEVLSELKKSDSIWRNYNKSSFTATQKEFLKQNKDLAISRATMLKELENPSSGIYQLLNILGGTGNGSPINQED